QIGMLINELEKQDLLDNTVIVVWSDHGFHLGELGLWAKTSNFELDTRVPLIIATPKQKTGGSRTDAIVELVDIYPTLSELAGIPLPEGLDGESLLPVLKEPRSEEHTSELQSRENLVCRLLLEKKKK